MTLSFKKRRLRTGITHPAVVETEVARLLLLSLPPGYRLPPTDGKR
jgi:hypothetical protein